MNNFNCIIVDDEHNAREVIKRYISQVEWLQLKEEFKDPLKALHFLHTETVDIIFLDINMPGLNGVEFIQSLTKKPTIIFTTAYAEFALDGYENDVADYLLKPIRFERFLKAINKVKSSSEGSVSEDDFIMVKIAHGLQKIRLEEILFLKKDSNYIEIHQVDGRKDLIRENMNTIYDVFPQQHFMRIHKSFVVAKRHIKIIESHQVTLQSGHKISIGPSYREDIIKEFPYRK
ncbi:LytR/AlgR family response regulator transcription factor [Fulvivirga lutea]|uniref:Response regulator transcription factor n=1 Tax=Fulvivirga lutea TaxID=2810512 RepID=A0A975A1T4_9BACT|nr:LytTR family DNA-binding domain-containing protein [Fulvivirga lutea]QSE98769.1 response regulator transcription factor [Fulvivirga lutea]